MNLILLIGNVGQEPEKKTFSNGDPYWTISIATTEMWKTKEGEKKTDTTWHNLMIAKRFEAVMAYVKKGTKIHVSGKQQHKSYEKDGEKKYYSQVAVREIELLGSRSDSQQAANPANSSEAYHQQQQAKSEDSTAFDDPTDDLPF